MPGLIRRATGDGLLVLLILFVFAVTGARAQDGGTGAPVAPRPVIGVLDLNQVMAKGAAAKKLLAQREGFAETYQADVAKTEKELRQQDQDLTRQRAALAPDVLAERRQAFQDRVSEFQAQVQKRRRNLERSFDAAMSTIQAAVIRVTKDIAEKRGMNIVLYRSQTFLFDPEMDITGPVLAEVNRVLPTVTMQDPATLPDQPEDEGQGH